MKIDCYGTKSGCYIFQVDELGVAFRDFEILLSVDSDYPVDKGFSSRIVDHQVEMIRDDCLLAHTIRSIASGEYLRRNLLCEFHALFKSPPSAIAWLRTYLQASIATPAGGEGDSPNSIPPTKASPVMSLDSCAISSALSGFSQRENHVHLCNQPSEDQSLVVGHTTEIDTDWNEIHFSCNQKTLDFLIKQKSISGLIEGTEIFGVPIKIDNTLQDGNFRCSGK